MLLTEINEKYKNELYGTDKGTDHSYLEVYDEWFKPFRDKKQLKLLEIGAHGGWSSKLWLEYFTDLAELHYVDINYGCWTAPNDAKIIKHTGDSSAKNTFTSLPEFDIVIDDGSHRLDHQLNAFYYLKPKLAPNAIYIIEDIQDLDKERTEIMAWEPKFEIYDLRTKKGRWDDVLVLYRN